MVDLSPPCTEQSTDGTLPLAVQPDPFAEDGRDARTSTLLACGPEKLPRRDDGHRSEDGVALIAAEDYPISQCPYRGMPSSVVDSSRRRGKGVCSMRVRSIGFLLVLATGAVFAGPAQSDTILGAAARSPKA